MTKHPVKNNFTVKEALRKKGKPLPFAPAKPSLCRNSHLLFWEPDRRRLLGLSFTRKASCEQPLPGWHAGNGEPTLGTPAADDQLIVLKPWKKPFRITMGAYDNKSFSTASGEVHFSTGATFLSLVSVSKAWIPFRIMKVRMMRI